MDMLRRISSIMPSSIAPSISAQLKAKYALEGANQVVVDEEAIKELGVSSVLGDYLDEGGGCPSRDRSNCARLDGSGCAGAVERAVGLEATHHKQLNCV